MKIQWPATKFDNLGRNGFTKSRGIEVTNVGGEIHLEGINARGEISSGRLVVPVSELDSLVAALRQARALEGATRVYPVGDHFLDTDEAILPGVRRVSWSVGERVPNAVRVRSLEGESDMTYQPAKRKEGRR